MSRLSISHFILIGLLAWGLPSAYFIGWEAFLLVTLVALPVAVSLRFTEGQSQSVQPQPGLLYTCLIAIGVVYVFVDSIFGRQYFAFNMFVSEAAVSTTIEKANVTMSQGRDLFELVGGIMLFYPFAMIDQARVAPRRYRKLLFVVAGLMIFYEIGISRGLMLAAMIALLIGLGARPLAQGLTAIGAFALFGVATMVRGDATEVSIQAPLTDAFLYPYLNLERLLVSPCGTGEWTQFLDEFFKKFLPSPFFDKSIFSFNIEMTTCIYPMYSRSIESISVFTYMGELLYYAPSTATALAAGMLLAALGLGANAFFVRYDLPSLRVFVGLMAVVVLRSRVQDLLSFLVFLVVFGTLWTIVVSRKPSIAQTPLSSAAGWKSFPVRNRTGRVSP